MLNVLATWPAAAAAPSQPQTGDLAVSIESDGVILTVDLPTYDMETLTHDGVSYQRVVVDGSDWPSAAAPGTPSLPQRGVMLAAPPTGAVTLELLDVNWQPVKGSFRIAPAPAAVLQGEGDAAQVVEQWQLDAAAYAQRTPTPTQPATLDEEGWLRGYRFVRLSLHPFQFTPADGTLRVATTMRLRLRFSEPAARSTAATDPRFAAAFEAIFANFAQAQAAGWQVRPDAPDKPADPAGRAANTDPAIKVTVNADGLTRVSYAALQNAGVPAATLNSLNPRTFRLLDADVEQSIYVAGESDGVFNPTDSLMFYGQRNANPLSDDNNIYWLSWGGVNGLRMASQNVAPAAAPLAATLLATAHAEENLEYKQQRPFVDWLQPVVYDSWYYGQILTSRSVTFSGMAVDTASAVAPTLAVWLAGDKQNAGNYQVNFTLNSSATQSKSWSNTRILDGSLALPAGALANGNNTVVVQPVNLTGTGTDYSVWLDWLKLTYPYNGQYLADTPFTNPTAGLWRYQISALPAAAPWLLNIANPAQPKLLTDATTTGSGPYTLSWQMTTTASDKFLVVPDSAVRTPVALSIYQPSTLLDPTQQVDYLMITHPSLLTAIQPLADYHTANGMTVRVVNVQDIYDLYSDGSMSAAAIRSYLAYAYSSYTAPAPTYVLLVGDGSMNPRGYVVPGIATVRYNLIPPWLGGFDAWSGSSVSDNGYVRVQGSDLLGEMVISRLPVNTPAETTTVVNKTIQYPTTFPASRALQTLWVADNPDNDNPAYGTQFFMATEETASELLPQFTVNRLYWCVPGTNACPTDPWVYTNLTDIRAAVVNQWNAGQLLIHFTGHGSITTWAHEQLFRVYWINQLNNATAMPFLLVSSCTNGYFVSPQYDGIDEGLLRAEGRGTIGGFTGVTFDTLHPQTVLLNNFVEAVMDDRITQTGMAVTVARARAYASLSSPDNGRSAVGHSMSGDPALVLAQPAACARGDINCDGVYDIVDVQLVAAAWGNVAWSTTFNPRTDLVQNGRIDINDIAAIATLWQTPLP